MGKIDAPTARSYLGEMQSALAAQGGIQNDLMNLESQYLPQWQKLQQQGLQGAMGNLSALYGSAIPQSEALQNQMLASQGRVYAGVGEQARTAYNNTLDPTTAGLYNTMASQAAQGLAGGRNLSDQETRMGQGAARAAMAARGMQMGNQAIAAEVLNSYNLSNAREDRARQFAGSVYGIGQQNAQQAMSMYGAPLMNQLGAVSATGLIGQAGAYNSSLGSKLFQPESQYNAELISANQQNEMQAAIANQQATTGLISAGIGAIGTMGGGFLSNPGLFSGSTAGGGGGGASFSRGMSTARNTYGGLGRTTSPMSYR